MKFVLVVYPKLSRCKSPAGINTGYRYEFRIPYHLWWYIGSFPIGKSPAIYTYSRSVYSLLSYRLVLGTLLYPSITVFTTHTNIHINFSNSGRVCTARDSSQLITAFKSSILIRAFQASLTISCNWKFYCYFVLN